jgi:pimeloyl-ACP methyl ester carboxylesterase
MRERVTRTAFVAGALPLDNPENLAQLNLMDRRLTEMARTHPTNAKLAFQTLGEIAAKLPHLWNGIAGRGLSARDVQTIHQLPGPGLAGMAAPALASGDGMVEEYRAWALPWGFGPEEINTPVSVWQGGQDHLIPGRWAVELASRIPDARLHVLPEEGHMLAYNHFQEIFDDLRP